ncbi:uncharacterized protein LOC132888166 isoform X2 [Neoarius graeffei]|uniref:uncharacterized protein LOC132888166 isoform X2 n=1 Tax=Neoarius graeffei TaxID=443677 RepID=UPI00298CDFDF|nr:uncharacterized protein LOC132888166 isoform X2 [Neoarius graeffei]
MTESQVRDTNRVRNMYEGVNPAGMTEREKKKHRDETLLRNPDVLFRIYQQEKLHVLLFMQTNTEEWKKEIQKIIPPHVSLQLTERCEVKGDLPIFNISGQESELEWLCNRFVEHRNKVIHNIQVAREQQDETEELRARVEELRLENNRLRGQLLDIQTRMRPPELYNEIRENIQHGGAAQMNRAAEIEEINVRIRELEQEISVLERRLWGRGQASVCDRRAESGKLC